MDVTIQTTRYCVHKVKCPSLSTDRNQTYRVCRACKKDARYQIKENLSNGIHDAAEKNLCSPTNVPFDIDRMQPNIIRLQGKGREGEGKSVEKKSRYSREDNLFSK
jgi:hypothetical protein